MPLGRLAIGFILFTVLEVIVMSAVADAVGWPVTLLLLLATAIVGSAIVRHQGMENWRRFNQRLQAGELPGSEAVESAMLLVGSLLLILPGFITDTLGALLLIPGIRRKLASGFMSKLQAQTTTSQHSAFFYRGTQFYTSGNVYEGEAKMQRDHQSANDPGANVIELPRPPTND